MIDFPVKINGITMIILFGMLQGVLIILYFAANKGIKAHRVFIYFLVLLLYVQIHSFLVRSGLIVYALFLFNTNIPIILLFGPLIFLYSKSISGKIVPIHQWFLHLLPFGLYLGYSFNFFLQDPAFKYNILVELLQLELPLQNFSQAFSSDPWSIQGWVVVEFLALHMLGYGTYSLVRLFKDHSIEIKTGKSQNQWMTFLHVILITAGLVLILSEGGVVNGQIFFQSPFPEFSTDLFSTFAMYGITCYLFLNSEFLKSTNKKYKKSSLSRKFMQEKLSIILHTIESSKLFLDPDFSLELLAQRTGLSKHHISQIINAELHCNFFSLTNKYRIEEAKRVLKQSDYVKIEHLAYQLGYKSKSSFYNAFKKTTNLTPSQYLARGV